jgi:two-component system response regulator AtoC
LVGPTQAAVLIVGESGTGKERIAEALHSSSGLTGPLVAVNCAAIPRDLIESELFGSEKGAYTGAHQNRAGLVEQAAGGTLFLDEIGELDLALQPKLLRFLESRRARRVGGRQEYSVEARIVAATNRDLREEIEEETFRADLFYRLSEVELVAPPLRDHEEDLPSLAAHFVDEANEKFGKHFVSLDPQLVKNMMGYEWPGNVRELRATIHRLIIMHDGPVLRHEWWAAPAVYEAAVRAVASSAGPSAAASAAGTLNRKQKWERARQLLEESGNDRTWTAAQLGIHPATLFRWQKSGKI